MKLSDFDETKLTLIEGDEEFPESTYALYDGNRIAFEIPITFNPSSYTDVCDYLGGHQQYQSIVYKINRMLNIRRVHVLTCFDIVNKKLQIMME